MFKFSRDGVSVLTILDTRVAEKSGLFPVKVQVVFLFSSKYYLNFNREQSTLFGSSGI